MIVRDTTPKPVDISPFKHLSKREAKRLLAICADALCDGDQLNAGGIVAKKVKDEPAYSTYFEWVAETDPWMTMADDTPDEAKMQLGIGIFLDALLRHAT